jgi:P27 family predicted phage terminase small subunit
MNADEPAPELPDDLTPPDWLTAEAKREWEDKAPMLQRLGLLTEADLDAFCLYCQTFARWKDAEQKLLESGLVVPSNSCNGFPIISPYLQISNKAQAQAMKMLVEFGLTPSARSRVTAAKKAAPDKKKERFFGPGTRTA